jgi:hypothetical protein
MNFWLQAMTPTSAGGAGLTLAQVAADFATSSETLALYPFLTLPNLVNAGTFVTQVYANMLNRAPDAAGLTFWTNELATGAITPGNLILDVEASVNQQTGTADALTLAAKGTVAENYVLSIAAANVPFTQATAHAVMAPGRAGPCLIKRMFTSTRLSILLPVIQLPRPISLLPSAVRQRCRPRLA